MESHSHTDDEARCVKVASTLIGIIYRETA